MPSYLRHVAVIIVLLAAAALTGCAPSLTLPFHASAVAAARRDAPWGDMDDEVHCHDLFSERFATAARR